MVPGEPVERPGAARRTFREQRCNDVTFALAYKITYSYRRYVDEDTALLGDGEMVISAGGGDILL